MRTLIRTHIVGDTIYQFVSRSMCHWWMAKIPQQWTGKSFKQLETIAIAAHELLVSEEIKKNE